MKILNTSFTTEQYNIIFKTVTINDATLMHNNVFASEGLCDLISIILQNINDEQKMKIAILNNEKLGSIVLKLMYCDRLILQDTIDSIKTKNLPLPDFLDCINDWRQMIEYNINCS